MLTQLAFACRQQRNWDLAIGTLEQAATIGSPESRQSAVEATGLVLREQGNAEAQLNSLRRRVDMARFHLATVLEPDAAVADLTSALDAFRGEPDNLAKIGLRLGRTLTERGDPDAAIPVLERAVELARRAGATRELGLIHLELANADPAKAEAHLRTALRILEFGFEVEADLVRTRMTELGYRWS